VHDAEVTWPPLDPNRAGHANNARHPAIGIPAVDSCLDYVEAYFMRAIIIGAGRGSRLMPTTADSPKCFAEVGGQRIIDWTVHAFRASNVNEIVFIGGYQIGKIRAAYPQFEFRHNDRWEQNNILASLFYARDLMDQPFVCSYSDILFRPAVIQGLLATNADMALSVDTAWLDRYGSRTQHPSDDAEKVTVSNGMISRIDRKIPEAAAHGEFTGIAKFSAAGAQRLREHYLRRHEESKGGVFRDGRTLEKAYLIQLFQDMIEAGERFAHVDTPGRYIEIDTQQDFDFARQNWAKGMDKP
jgi:L-glutamine-phosphate cytidylyltransferase